MNPIDAVFINRQHRAVIAYVTVGYPSIETTLKVVPLLAQSGCNIIELGIPFSDPLADGATIQKASFHALRNGVTVQLCIDTAKELSKMVRVPLVFMTYFNPVVHYGIAKFCNASAESGVSGLIIPDLPPEEGGALDTNAKANDIHPIYLLAPTSTDERIKLVAERSGGFIYLVSISGVTGARITLPQHLETFVKRVRTQTAKPLCVGFGISTPEQAQQVAQSANGVIIGSRIIQLMEEDASLRSIERFVKNVRDAVDKVESD